MKLALSISRLLNASRSAEKRPINPALVTTRLKEAGHPTAQSAQRRTSMVFVLKLLKPHFPQKPAIPQPTTHLNGVVLHPPLRRKLLPHRKLLLRLMMEALRKLLVGTVHDKQLRRRRPFLTLHLPPLLPAPVLPLHLHDPPLIPPHRRARRDDGIEQARPGEQRIQREQPAVRVAPQRLRPDAHARKHGRSDERHDVLLDRLEKFCGAALMMMLDGAAVEQRPAVAAQHRRVGGAGRRQVGRAARLMQGGGAQGWVADGDDDGVAGAIGEVADAADDLGGGEEVGVAVDQVAMACQR